MLPERQYFEEKKVMIKFIKATKIQSSQKGGRLTDRRDNIEVFLNVIQIKQVILTEDGIAKIMMVGDSDVLYHTKIESIKDLFLQ